MNPDVREKWVTALRSGKYQQHRTAVLKSLENEFCCLGVLCQIAEDEGITVSAPSPKNPGYLFGSDSYAFIRDEVILNWSGIGAEEGANNDQRVLARMNDTDKTFVEIADYIEENL